MNRRATSSSISPRRAGAHRRRGRRGHERDRHGARAHGSPRERLRPPRVAPRSSASRLLGVDDARRPRAPSNVPTDADAVVISTAIPASNPEVVAARERGIPVLRRADALRARSSPPARTIAVAGSHGKTTTSSMLALILRAAGWHPSFLIGGDLNEVGTNAVFDDGRVARRRSRRERRHVPASSRPTTRSSPTSSPTTSTTTATSPALVDAFEQLRRPGSPGAVRAVRRRRRSPPRIAARARRRRHLRVRRRTPTTGWTATRAVAAARRFALARAGEPLGAVELPVPGRHNAVNAAGAAAIGARARRALRRGRARARRLRRRRPSLPVPGRARRRHLRRRLRAPPERGRTP